MAASQGRKSSSRGSRGVKVGEESRGKRRAVWDGELERVIRESGGKLKLDFIDIKRAHFHARPKVKTYVDLPPERWEAGKCARLNYNLYGTRGAAAAWEEHYSERLVKWGLGGARDARVCLSIGNEGYG